MAMDLDRLSGGRFDLGIGAGWNADEHAMVGLDYPAYARRLDLLDEAAAVIHALWSGEPADHAGAHLTPERAEFHPRPPTATPMLVMGGKGPRTLEVVARHATEWNCSYVGIRTFRAKSAALDDMTSLELLAAAVLPDLH